jgi:hypothetical protein
VVDVSSPFLISFCRRYATLNLSKFQPRKIASHMYPRWNRDSRTHLSNGSHDAHVSLPPTDSVLHVLYSSADPDRGPASPDLRGVQMERPSTYAVLPVLPSAQEISRTPSEISQDVTLFPMAEPWTEFADRTAASDQSFHRSDMSFPDLNYQTRTSERRSYTPFDATDDPPAYNRVDAAQRVSRDGGESSTYLAHIPFTPRLS